MGSIEVGVNDETPVPVTTDRVVLYPELATGDSVVLDTDERVWELGELPLRVPVKVDDSRTDVDVSGRDVVLTPTDTVVDVPGRLVPER